MLGHTIQWSKKNKTQKTEKKSNRDPTKTQVWYKVLSVILERKKNTLRHIIPIQSQPVIEF
jgi:hypothetical protein